MTNPNREVPATKQMFVREESTQDGSTWVYRKDEHVVNDYSTPNVILFVNDTVTVESVWSRPYLPDHSPLLYYVRSHTTGLATHVTLADLSEPAEFELEVPR